MTLRLPFVLGNQKLFSTILSYALVANDFFRSERCIVSDVFSSKIINGKMRPLHTTFRSFSSEGSVIW